MSNSEGQETLNKLGICGMSLLILHSLANSVAVIFALSLATECVEILAVSFALYLACSITLILFASYAIYSLIKRSIRKVNEIKAMMKVMLVRFVIHLGTLITFIVILTKYEECSEAPEGIITVVIMSMDSVLCCVVTTVATVDMWNEIRQNLKIGNVQEFDSQGQRCVICIEDFKRNDIVLQLQCNLKHVFHRDCISDWVRVKLICPVCRAGIELDNTVDYQV